MGEQKPKRRDPRAEPSELPPALILGGDKPRPVEKVDRVAVERLEDIALPAAEEPPKETPARPARDSVRREVEAADPRLTELEPVLARGAWGEVTKMLGPEEKAGFLPPTLGLIYAVAQREAGNEERATAANQMAIRCMAGLLGVPEASPLALVLGKRLVRKNPAAWRERPAPPASVSITIVLIGLLLGAAVGIYFARAPLSLLFR